MDLVDRYLQAVKFWLPKNQKHRIACSNGRPLRDLRVI